MRGEPQIHTMFPFVAPTGPRSSPDCCGSVVHPKAALYPEHIYPLPVSSWDSPLGTILFNFVWQHPPLFPLNDSSLPSIRLDRPCFVMTASCESPVRTYERFTVTYTLLNNLQDFLAVRLVWTPEHAQAGRWAVRFRDLVPKEGKGSHGGGRFVAGSFGSILGWSSQCHCWRD